MAIDWPVWPKPTQRMLRHEVKNLIEMADDELPGLQEYQNRLIALADRLLGETGLKLARNAGTNKTLVWRERGNSRTRYTKLDKKIIERFVSGDTKRIFGKIERERIITNFMIRWHSFAVEQGTEYINALRSQEQIIQLTSRHSHGA